MARPGITREQVYEAAEALLNEGITPTSKVLRERIGSGSYNTIKKHLDQWRQEHGGSTPANIPDMPEKVAAAFKQTWAVAAQAAQEGVETQRQALEAMRREMERENAEMTAEIDRLEQALEGAEQALATEREGRAAAEAQATALQVENARLDERAKNVERRADELREQVDGLQAKFAEAASSRKRPPARKAREDEPAVPNVK